MRYAIFAVLLVSSLGLPDSCTQTTWTGGGGVPGPVNYWEDCFYTSSFIDPYSTPGSLFLDYKSVEHIVSDSFVGARAVYPVDIDGDEDLDVAAAGRQANEVAWFENLDGSGTAWIKHTVSSDVSGAIYVVSSDIDADGDPDLIASAHGANQVLWWENVDGFGTLWTERIIDADYVEPTIICARDIDGDTDCDVVVKSNEGGQYDVCWWENDGSGQGWEKHVVAEDMEGLRGIDAGDVNGDGSVDILGVGFSFSLNAGWWENVNGSGLEWEFHEINTGLINARSIKAVDFQSDGKMDVLIGAYYYDGGVYWFCNEDGLGTDWERYEIDVDDCEDLVSIWADDVDLDGDQDVFSTGGTESDLYWVRWYENLGSALSWQKRHVDPDFKTYGVRTGNIDGCDEVDVLGAFPIYNGGRISWWAIKDLVDGSLESSIMHAIIGSDWQSIDWTCNQPESTYVSFQLRVSSDPDNMGPWSDTLPNPCSLEGVLEDGKDWIQYRAILSTDLREVTPELEDVTVYWNPLSVEEPGDQSSPEPLSIDPNPGPGSMTITFWVAEPTAVRISLYDLSGRLVTQRSIEECPTGKNSIRTDRLRPGIYLCRVVAGGRVYSRKAVVLR